MLKDPRWDVDTNVYSLAADALEKYGHCKSTIMDGHGRMCLIGAVSYALNGNAFRTLDMISISALRSLINDECPIEWNNADETTSEDVIKLLRKAALVL